MANEDKSRIEISPLFKAGAPMLLFAAFAAQPWWFAHPAETELHGARIISLLLIWGALLSFVLWRFRDHRWTQADTVMAFFFAVLLNLCFLFTTPLFSDDIWRYLWEGHVQWSGANPFEHSPAYLGNYRTDDPFWWYINHRDISAIYPAGAQVLFRLITGVSYTLVAMKAMMMLAGLAVGWLLMAMLHRRGLSPHWALAWLWSPFVCFEVSGAGHLDVLAALFMLVWLDQLDRRREKTAAISLGLAIAMKLIPVVLLPVAFRWHRAKWTPLLALVIVGLCYLPYLDWQKIRGLEPSSGIVETLGVDDLTRALRTYEAKWRHNDSVHWLIYEGVVEGHLLIVEESPVTRHELAARQGNAIHRENDHALAFSKMVCYILFIVGLVYLLRFCRGATLCALAVMGLFLILRPTIHPWYFLMVLPFAILERRWSWFVLSLLSLGTYVTVEHYRQTGEWHESKIAWAIQWGVFFVMLLGEWRKSASVQTNERSSDEPQL